MTINLTMVNWMGYFPIDAGGKDIKVTKNNISDVKEGMIERFNLEERAAASGGKSFTERRAEAMHVDAGKLDKFFTWYDDKYLGGGGVTNADRADAIIAIDGHDGTLDGRFSFGALQECIEFGANNGKVVACDKVNDPSATATPAQKTAWEKKQKAVKDMNATVKANTANGIVTVQSGMTLSLIAKSLLHDKGINPGHADYSKKLLTLSKALEKNNDCSTTIEIGDKINVNGIKHLI
ncbi:MAG: hypothetical protein QE263_02955 [Vampirovibrionales bacterium]|nr:hypothetical protein [Vampirovibrionales bacterium]